MGWTSKMRANRYSHNFKPNGEYRGNKTGYIKCTKESELSEDTRLRMKIIEEIDKRCNDGEEIEIVTSEISKRDYIKEKFSYYAKNGITDLSTIMKNWYNSYKKNQLKNNNIRLR